MLSLPNHMHATMTPFHTVRLLIDCQPANQDAQTAPHPYTPFPPLQTQPSKSYTSESGSLWFLQLSLPLPPTNNRLSQCQTHTLVLPLFNSTRAVSLTSDSLRITVICPTDNSSIGINLHTVKKRHIKAIIPQMQHTYHT